ncbi:sushi, nidogen and EGF-like domain-containing protein 1 [Xenopus laevis]|uniref:Sushi, nidogen and EGF-like domain-containing protein 1 n=2 Tax=Xenopus laevis TaxID=8355 RepID=A0A1L8FPQ4_XENLA|nr:sushi, nidogen and EGF-like domain-containing protein 1 [Xenopus laevis]XP_041425682.1 sushi, nidogen and EGF-like domain-containing protein 1 [Xenopus laevis]OCT73577.1 hypothetical protein XELAEV_18036556mg [Xenopus laevis]
MDLFYITKIVLLAHIVLQGAAATNGVLYEYGNATDKLSQKVNFGEVEITNLTVKFPLFGKNYSSFYLCLEGILDFNRGNCFASPVIPRDGSLPIIAPFWGDFSIALSGDIYYRQSNDPRLLANATQDINKYFPGLRFSAQWVFIATWDKVTSILGIVTQVNTLQVVLITDGTLSFVLFNYADIQWSHGAAAGLYNGNASEYYQLNNPRDSVFNLTSSSNINYPGRWAFRVDKLQVEVPTIQQTTTTMSQVIYGNGTPTGNIQGTFATCKIYVYIFALYIVFPLNLI